MMIMNNKITFYGIATLLVSVLSLSAFSQIDVSKTKHYIGSGADTSYFVYNANHEWNSNNHILGYLHDEGVTIKEMIIELDGNDDNFEVRFSGGQIDSLAVSSFSYSVDNQDTTSFDLLTASLGRSSYNLATSLDPIVKNTIVSLVFNNDKERVSQAEPNDGFLVANESSNYLDESILKDQPVVGKEEITTYLLFDFNDPKFNKTLSYHISLPVGATLADALAFLNTHFDGFDADMGSFLNSIRIDSLASDVVGNYWGIWSNNLDDDKASFTNSGLTTVIEEGFSYGFSYGQGGTVDVPLFEVNLPVGKGLKPIDVSKTKYYIGSGSDTSYFVYNANYVWNSKNHILGYLHDEDVVFDEMINELLLSDDRFGVRKGGEVDSLAVSSFSYSVDKEDTTRFDLSAALIGTTSYQPASLYSGIQKGYVYALVFNVDNEKIELAIPNDGVLIANESSDYWDGKIPVNQPKVGLGELSTHILIDFNDSKFDSTLSYHISLAEGATLLEALSFMNDAYDDFEADFGYFLNTITVDSLESNKDNAYWSIWTKEIGDESYSYSNSGLSTTIVNGNLYGFSYGFGNSPDHNVVEVFPSFDVDPIDLSSADIVNWAKSATVTRGFMDVALGVEYADFGAADSTLGEAKGISTNVVSLGDGGSIVLTFEHPIINGNGPDFAVFENGFDYQGKVFGELAFVEVSSDGSNFYRFPAVSLQDYTAQLGGFDAIDNTKILNLAGGFIAGQGTPFDLEDFEDVGIEGIGLDLNAITHVKLVDVVGSTNTTFASYDFFGNIINDPYPTNSGSSGFDLDGVAVLNQDESATSISDNATVNLVYPNPATSKVTVRSSSKGQLTISDFSGAKVYSSSIKDVLLIDLLGTSIKKGMYLIEFPNGQVEKLMID
jgi:hypothetical protein